MAEEKKKYASKVKEERLLELRKKLEKDFGKGTIMGAKDKPSFHDYIPTGSIGLDKALGIGGLPRGRIVEIYGPESSGKTTLAIHVMSEAMKIPGVRCGFVDAEHAFDTMYAENLGVDLERLDISQPDYGEQALDIASEMLESKVYDVVVVDSVAALVPLKELQGDMGDAVMGGQARLMSQAMRKLVGHTAKSNAILIFINQMRDKIGVMFGSPETTTGGNALKFYASIRLDIRRQASEKEAIKEGDVRIGNPTTVKVVKNKVAPPFRKAEFDILYGEGIDKYGELVDMAVDTNVLVKSGTYYSYKEETLAQGRLKAIQLLKDNDELADEIRLKVLQSFSPIELSAEEIKRIDDGDEGKASA